MKWITLNRRREREKHYENTSSQVCNKVASRLVSKDANAPGEEEHRKHLMVYLWLVEAHNECFIQQGRGDKSWAQHEGRVYKLKI